MADFDKAVEKLLVLEGGYVNHPNDRGRATKYGISLNFLQSINPGATETTIKMLTLDQAKDLYQRFFWDKGKLHEVHDQNVAEQFFNAIVHFGEKTAILLMQKTINTMRHATLIEDGAIGPKTLNAINTADPVSLIANYKVNIIQRYVNKVIADRTQEVFLLGWVRRALKG